MTTLTPLQRAAMAAGMIPLAPRHPGALDDYKYVPVLGGTAGLGQIVEQAIHGIMTVTSLDLHQISNAGTAVVGTTTFYGGGTSTAELSHAAALKKIKVLEQRIAELQGDAEPFALKTMSANELKKAIKAFFERHHGETIYPSDVSDELGVDYERVARVIDQLEKDGQIERA